MGILKKISDAIFYTPKKENKEGNKTSHNKKINYEFFKELKRNSGKLEDFEKLLLEPGKVGIIVGARGSGKSALGMRILENIKSKKKEKVYALGFSNIPDWIIPLTNLKQLKDNSFLLADESGINFSSRNFMSSANKLLSEFLLISRHKNISILFITQNSSNIDVNTLRQADYLLLKPSSLLQLDFERTKIKEIYQEVESDFKKFNSKDTTYIYSDTYRGFVKNSLPSFWTEKISKGYNKKLV